MVDNPDPGISKKVDESWKEQVEKEKKLPAAPKESPRPQAQAKSQAREPVSEAAGPRGTSPGAGRPGGQAPQPPETDFGFFLSSLSMQELVALGEVPQPDTHLQQENLEQARYFIDLLGVLQEKTQGNLTPEEASLLEGVLYELRMKYVARTQGAGL